MHILKREQSNERQIPTKERKGGSGRTILLDGLNAKATVVKSKITTTKLATPTPRNSSDTSGHREDAGVIAMRLCVW